MSTPNRTVIERLYEAFSRGDLEGALAEIGSPLDWNEAENFAYADRNPYQSADAVKQGVFGRLVTEWSGYEAPAHELLEAGDVVIALGRSRGTHRQTGKAFDAEYAHVWRLKDGKIVGFKQYIDTLGVWRAMQAR